MGVAGWATKLWHGSIFCVCTKNWIRRRRRERTGQARGLMTDLLKLILGVLASLFRSRAKLEAENLVLRQQINVLRRRMPKRLDLNKTDRFLFVGSIAGFPPSGRGCDCEAGNDHSLAPRSDFKRIGAGDRATVLADRRSRLSCARSLAR